MMNDEQVKNFKWISSNYAELSKKYNNKWIAVLGQQVVDFSETDSEVKIKTQKKFRGDSQKLDGLVTEFVTQRKFPELDV